eukprot:gene16313-22501_t
MAENLLNVADNSGSGAENAPLNGAVRLVGQTVPENESLAGEARLAAESLVSMAENLLNVAENSGSGAENAPLNGAVMLVGYTVPENASLAGEARLAAESLVSMAENLLNVADNSGSGAENAPLNGAVMLVGYTVVENTSLAGEVGLAAESLVSMAENLVAVAENASLTGENASLAGEARLAAESLVSMAENLLNVAENSGSGAENAPLNGAVRLVGQTVPENALLAGEAGLAAESLESMAENPVNVAENSGSGAENSVNVAENSGSGAEN